MQPFLFSSSERIRHWKSFRSTLDNTLTDEEQLLSTMKYWYQYPLIDRYIDPYGSTTWPTPWELIHENCFCRSSLAFMMEQTLLMSADNRWTTDRLNLKYIDNKELCAEFIVLVVDNKYVVNYDLDQLIKFDFVKKTCIIRLDYKLKNNVHFII